MAKQTSQSKRNGVPGAKPKPKFGAPSKLKSKALVPQVLVVGSGEAFDVDLGNTAYLLRGAGLPSVLFDCGYQIPERLWKKGLHSQLDAVCFTHLHADHSFGIVPMLVRYWEEGRVAPLHILGPRGTERFVMRLLDTGYPGFSKRIKFPLHFHTLSPQAAIEFRGLKFQVAPTVHSVLNYTVRVDLQVKNRPASFAVSGDGQITEATKTLTDDVEHLFQELYCEKPGIPVHADLETLKAWIAQSSVKSIYTSHFSRGDKQRLSKMITRQKSESTKWAISKPGLTVKL